MVDKRIYKYSIPLANLEDRISIQMPKGAKVISVGNQNGCLCFWAIVDINSTDIEYVPFHVVGTGHLINSDIGIDTDESRPFIHWHFLGTVMFDNGSLVFHIFEKTIRY